MDLLRRWLIPAGLDPARPLVVVPAGFLRMIPWPALHAGPVTQSPSARLWARSAATAVGPAHGVALIAGPGLDGATEEVHRLSCLHPGSTALTPPDGTVEAALAAVRTADLVHLACHGHVRADNPMFSALELSDGLLTAQALESGGVVPPRIVLSACNVAADASLPGGEQLGFVSALLAHGAQGLIASLTLVPDLDAVEFMVWVHTALRSGRTMAQALHDARSATDTDDVLGLAVSSSFVAYGAG
jgi:CHAT domain-containing protein